MFNRTMSRCFLANEIDLRGQEIFFSVPSQFKARMLHNTIRIEKQVRSYKYLLFDQIYYHWLGYTALSSEFF